MRIGPPCGDAGLGQRRLDLRLQRPAGAVAEPLRIEAEQVEAADAERLQLQVRQLVQVDQQHEDAGRRACACGASPARG